MDPFMLDALIVPLFVTWFIPNSIRDITTGEYLGMNNDKVRLCILLLFLLESWTMLQRHDPGLLTALRIGFCVALPILGAHLFVKLTHKKLFGREIMFTRWW